MRQEHAEVDQAILPDAIQHPSPNQDARPAKATINLLVIHNISLPPGEFGGPWIDDLFKNRLDPQAHPYFKEVCNLRVSSHLLIRRGGQLIQYVPFDQRAWHAGKSSYAGKPDCNDFSIGIELEGTDTQPYTQAQYDVLVQVTRELQLRYPAITSDRVIGHADIAPNRKSDPGPAFDWQYFRHLLHRQT
ncbi:MAG: 1,6-anhydro-N-acetylmuramyl-L-alanine amidase AmpD [Gammaproteobacteria bacterium]|nr:1,6-anhydro-N-acetylmuramyl-L-alanine amidase AmpD [Gammaproteobacteria bacterium]